MRPGTAISVTDDVEMLELELPPDNLKTFDKALKKKLISIFTLLHRNFAIIHDLSVGKLPVSPTASNMVSKLTDPVDDVTLELFVEPGALLLPG